MNLSGIVARGISALALLVALSQPMMAQTEVTWQSLVEGAQEAFEVGRLQDAQDMLVQAVEITEPESRERAAVLNNLAIVLEAKGDIEAAEGIYTMVLLLWTRIEGPSGGNVPRTMGNLADLLYRSGKISEALDAYETAVQIAILAEGPDVEDVLAILKETRDRIRQEIMSDRTGSLDHE